MNLGLAGRAALVGASSKGIGKACAFGFAREGTNVTICARHEDELAQVAQEIRDETGVEVLAVPTDLTNPDQIKRLVQQHMDRFGRIDVLVTNNGGPPASRFVNTTTDQWQLGLDMSLWNVIRLCSEVVPHMQRQHDGRIVNLVSVSAREPIDGLILSNVARAGVLGLAKTMANELAHDGIRINNVCPGSTLTPRMATLSAGLAQQRGATPTDVIADWEANIPLGRMGKPDEIANVVVFLASDAASFVTGTTIVVDGGQTRAVF
ncbi:MAG: SDR family oxidoreductase [Ardenticatenaceae bacterium]|nr:SDR family oxidoreductase [Ardenticatenaceae bacterium]HBY93288.1 3-oxoacyl-ACP reductase [Chloroflexota bacterium]